MSSIMLLFSKETLPGSDAETFATACEALLMLIWFAEMMVVGADIVELVEDEDDVVAVAEEVVREDDNVNVDVEVEDVVVVVMATALE